MGQRLTALCSGKAAPELFCRTLKESVGKGHSLCTSLDPLWNLCVFVVKLPGKLSTEAPRLHGETQRHFYDRLRKRALDFLVHDPRAYARGLPSAFPAR